MKELRNKLGSMEYDGLITGLNPPVRVDGGTIAKLEAPAVLKRGTLLGKGEDGLLTVYGGTPCRRRGANGGHLYPGLHPVR